MGTVLPAPPAVTPHAVGQPMAVLCALVTPVFINALHIAHHRPVVVY